MGGVVGWVAMQVPGPAAYRHGRGQHRRLVPMDEVSDAHPVLQGRVPADLVPLHAQPAVLECRNVVRPVPGRELLCSANSLARGQKIRRDVREQAYAAENVNDALPLPPLLHEALEVKVVRTDLRRTGQGASAGCRCSYLCKCA
jgi:hypothetical protein